MKTCIDWLAFRTKSDPYKTLEAMRPMFGSTGYLLTFKPGLKGKDGWMWAGEISMAGDISLGRIDYGGDSQREWVRVNLTGEGCGFVENWEEAEKLGEVLDAEIKRLDIQLTTCRGEISDEMIAAAHANGLFTSGGRPPEMKTMTSSNPRAGKTRYIGNRKYHKFLRCYEKGFEMIKDAEKMFPVSAVNYGGEMHPPENIYRVELELKPSDNKVIPWEAIGHRDSIFAGAYPFCAQVMPAASHWVLNSLPDIKPLTCLETAFNHCRVAYGPTLRAGLMAHGNDDAAKLKIFNRLLSETPSQALVDAGVLTVNHF